MRTAFVIVLLVLACALAGAGEPFQYERHAIEAGELWRFATASLVHWSVDQLIWDSIAFIALASIAATRWPMRFHVTTIGSALAIPIIVHIGMPNVTTYRGLSAIDSALFALVAARLLMIPSLPAVWREAPLPAARGEGGRRPGEGRPHRLVILVCALGFFAKIGFELVTGSTLFVRDLAPGVAPLPIAHVAGAAIGVFSSLPWSNARWSSLRWSFPFPHSRRWMSTGMEFAPRRRASRPIASAHR